MLCPDAVTAWRAAPQDMYTWVGGWRDGATVCQAIRKLGYVNETPSRAYAGALCAWAMQECKGRMGTLPCWARWRASLLHRHPTTPSGRGLRPRHHHNVRLRYRRRLRPPHCPKPRLCHRQRLRLCHRHRPRPRNRRRLRSCQCHKLRPHHRHRLRPRRRHRLRLCHRHRLRPRHRQRLRWLRLRHRQRLGPHQCPRLRLCRRQRLRPHHCRWLRPRHRQRLRPHHRQKLRPHQCRRLNAAWSCHRRPRRKSDIVRVSKAANAGTRLKGHLTKLRHRRGHAPTSRCAADPTGTNPLSVPRSQSQVAT